MIHILTVESYPWVLCGKRITDEINYSWGKVDNDMLGCCPECHDLFEDWRNK